jgi:hypothetical protein
VAQDFDKGGWIEYPVQVRVLSIARVLFALLAFQLSVGLQVGVAYASSVSPMVGGMDMAGHATDAVSAQVSTATVVTANGTTATGVDSCPMHAKAPAGTPADKHDCCKSSGCQGHCGSVPLAFNVSLTRNPPASTRVRPASTERAVIAPADTHFRPPILS